MNTNVFEGSTVLITGASGRGGVINVASTGAFQPVPCVAVYSASKAFVMSFSEALAGEYGGRGIRVLALCPGNNVTNLLARPGWSPS